MHIFCSFIQSAKRVLAWVPQVGGAPCSRRIRDRSKLRTPHLQIRSSSHSRFSTARSALPALLALGLTLSRALAVTVNHAGLPHTPVGTASITETNGMLEVSGITSSGSNGVAIALGGARGWRGDFGTPLTLMDGDGLDGTAKFDPNQFVEVVTKISAPANPAQSVTIEGTVDCWICPKKPKPEPPIPMGQMQVLLFDQNDKVVSTIHLDNGVPLNLPLASPTQTVAIASCAFTDSGHGELTWRYSLDHPISLEPQPAMIQFVKQLAVQYVGWPEDPPLPSPQPGTTRSITLRPKLTAANPSAGHLQLAGESLQEFGHLHQTMGQALFDAPPAPVHGPGTTLALSNLGSSSCNDGVSVKLDPGAFSLDPGAFSVRQNRFSARWNDLDPGAFSQPGASFTMSAVGNFVGMPSQPLGSMKILKTATGMNLINDFTSSGSQSALILVMRNGTFMGSFHLNHNTPLPFSGPWPRSGTVGPRLSTFVPPWGPICFYEDWPIDVTVFPPGGEPIVGNSIRVLVDDLPQQLDGLSSVDFIVCGFPRFEITGEESSRTGLIFAGLAHAPLGNASLQLDSAAGGGLTVSGIGASGNDGVRLMTGGGGGATMSLGVFNPDVLPIDAFLNWAAIDPRDQTILNLKVQPAPGGGGAIYADYSGLGAPTANVAVYSNDVLVAYAHGIPANAPVVNWGGGGPPFPLILNPCILHPLDCYGTFDFSIPDPTGPVITLPGLAAVHGTRVQIQPDVAAGPHPWPWAVQRIEITGRNLGTLNISSEGLVASGLEHHVLGRAQYSFDTPNAVAVGNLGSGGPNGADGVEVILPKGANSYSSDWVALNPQPLPPVSEPVGLTVTATGSVNGGPDQNLGSLQMLNNGTGIQMAADFSPLGSAAQRVELWRDCTLVSSYTVPATAGSALTSSGGPGGISMWDDDDICPPWPPGPPPWWWIKWDTLNNVTTPAGDHFDVNRVSIRPDLPGLTLGGLTRVSFQMPGPQRLVFVRESANRRGLNFDGNQHFALGQATLIMSATGDLIIGNIGTSGADGCEISLGGADWCEVASPSIPLPPPSGKLVFDYHAVIDGLSDRTAARLTIEAGASGETLFAGDMSGLGATHYTLMVLDNGVATAIATNRPDPTFTAASNSAPVGPSFHWDPRRDKRYVRIKVPKLPGNPGPLFSLTPGVTGHGDEVIIIPEDATRTLGPQNRLLITAANLGSFTITHEELGRFGNGHTGLGFAQLHPTTMWDEDDLCPRPPWPGPPWWLTVDHLGSSGNDGVQIDLGDSRNGFIWFERIDPSVAQGPYPQPWILARALARIGGAANQQMGSLRFTGVASGVQLDADFTPLGVSAPTIEVWLSGQLLQRVTGHTGVVATVEGWPIALGAASSDPMPARYIVPFGRTVAINISGQAALQGDELRVLAEGSSQTVASLQGINLFTSGIDAVTIQHEGFTPALMPRIGSIRPVTDGVELSIPTVFGYNHTLEAVSALGPQPLPWAPLTTFFGDGSVKVITIPATAPQQFFRLRVE